MPEPSFFLTGPYGRLMCSGLAVSLGLLGATLALALPLAFVVALLRLSRHALFRCLGVIYVESVRNIPLLAHLLFWYFAAPELLPAAWKEKLYEHHVEAISAVVGLTVYTAAYMAEDIRSGIRAVPRGQPEAARALGLGEGAVMRWVVLPQAVRITLPPLVSQTLNLWKNTSLATVIGVAEMMYQAAQIESATFRSVEAFLFASAAYLTLSLLLSGLGAWWQHRHPVRVA